MILTFLSHMLKRFSRSPSVGRDVAVQLAVGFIGISIVVYSLAFGFGLESFIAKTLHHENTLAFLNSMFFYYFVFEAITRYFIQSKPALEAAPYLHLPIRKVAVVNFLLGKSMVSLFNVMVLLLFAPFAFTVVAREHGTTKAWQWLITLWCVSLLTHFIVVLLKQKISRHFWGEFYVVLACACAALADYLGFLNLSKASETVFSSAVENYSLVTGVAALVLLVYVFTVRSFVRNLYAEDLNASSGEIVRATHWSFLQRFGLLGSWIRLELKLIFRNKRSRELFILHILFFLVALGMYTRTKDSAVFGVPLLFGMICSGFFIMNYGQYLFSWQGAHFDFTMTQPTSLRLFVEAKFWLLASTTVLWFLFSIPLVFLGWQFLLINVVTSLYNIGVNIFIVMNMSLWGAKRINLRHSGGINIEGAGAAQWVMGIPLIATPYLFFAPFSLSGNPWLGLVAVGIPGVMGIIFRKRLLDFTVSRIIAMRYQRASDFRKE